MGSTTTTTTANDQKPSMQRISKDVPTTGHSAPASVALSAPSRQSSTSRRQIRPTSSMASCPASSKRTSTSNKLLPADTENGKPHHGCGGSSKEIGHRHGIMRSFQG